MFVLCPKWVTTDRMNVAYMVRVKTCDLALNMLTMRSLYTLELFIIHYYGFFLSHIYIGVGQKLLLTNSAIDGLTNR